MKTFYCPYCNEKLSLLNGTVIKLKGTLTCDTFKCISNFYLPASLGQYGCIVDDHLNLKEGAKIDFHCSNPKCSHSFTAAYDDDLAEIKMIDEEGHEYAVVFNRVYGKESTFVADHKMKTLKSAYGKDKETYIRDFDKPINFFGE
jgi:competence CoiA-like predicted nuclease